MRKPKAFIAEIATLGGAALTGAVASAAASGAKNARTTSILTSTATAALGAGLIVRSARQERQNQRLNARLDRLISETQQLQDPESGTSALLDELSSRIDRLPSWIDTVLAERLETQRAALAAAAKTGQYAPAAIPSPSPNGKKRAREFGVANSETKQTRAGEFTTTLDLDVDKFLAPYEPVHLTASPLEITVDVEGATEANIDLTLLTRDGKANAKAALVAVKVLDEAGSEMDFPVLPSRSDKYGYFSYLGVTDSVSENRVAVRLPRRAKKLALSFYQWGASTNLQNRVRVTFSGKNPEWYASRKPAHIKVAAILDEFSYNSFRYECDLVSLDYSTWREQIEAHQPDLFFCESAWSGHDSKARPWKGRVYASENFNYENRTELLKILEYCKARGIPTVFWNKEDPSHYEDKKHNFVDTALRFDHIFTTDDKSAARYRSEYGHQSVHVMQFAVQPRLFNPANGAHRSRDVVFAGGWYSNHEQRSLDMETMFDAVEASDRELKIYDRFYGSDDPTKIFPRRFQYALNPPVSGEDMAHVYKESEIGMTVNTETVSRTMFARRIFELMACNTYVVSNYSNGVYELFGDDVLYLDKNPSGLKQLSDEEMNRAREVNLRRVLSSHTYRERFADILAVAQVPHDRSVSVPPLVVRVNSFEEASDAYAALKRVGQWGAPRIILLSSAVDNLAYADALTEFNRGGIAVVWEPMLQSGGTPMNQLYSGNELIVLIPLERLSKGNIRPETFADHAMHAQYTDIPVVAATDLVGANIESRFSQVRSGESAPTLVKDTHFKGLIQDLQSGQPSLYYVI